MVQPAAYNWEYIWNIDARMDDGCNQNGVLVQFSGFFCWYVFLIAWKILLNICKILFHKTPFALFCLYNVLCGPLIKRNRMSVPKFCQQNFCGEGFEHGHRFCKARMGTSYRWCLRLFLYFYYSIFEKGSENH